MQSSLIQKPSLLFIVANVRKHVGAKDNYYGNCVTGQLVVTTSGSVANGPIMDIVKMIRHAKEKIGKQFKEKRMAVAAATRRSLWSSLRTCFGTTTTSSACQA